VNPYGNIIADVNGNIYGTTYYKPGFSPVVFRVAPNGAFTVLYAFGDELWGPVGLTYRGESSGMPFDGTSPLYGAAIDDSGVGNGFDYQLANDGSHWNLTVIHSFVTSSQPNGVIMDASGNLYGTTTHGGKNGGGLMYKLAHDTWKETVLHQFLRCALAPTAVIHGRAC